MLPGFSPAEAETEAAQDVCQANAREELAQTPESAEIAEADGVAVVLSVLPDTVVEIRILIIVRGHTHGGLGMLYGGDPVPHAVIGHGGKVIPLRIPGLGGHRVQDADSLVELPGMLAVATTYIPPAFLEII